MSSVYSTSLEKLQKYKKYTRSKKSSQASRSINPEFPQISKQDDVTLYNSANFNVYFYKDYPNRARTPIKSESPCRPLGYKHSVSPKKQFITTFMNYANVDPDVQRSIVKYAMDAPIRTDLSPPKLASVQPGSKRFVMNDFHKRETNPGFARNSSGGYYTK